MPALAGLPEGVLTFLLTDIEGSTRAWEADPQAMADAIALHDRILAGLIELHQGVQVEAGREGDSVFAVFTDPQQAAACALQAQRAFRGAEWPAERVLRIRIALHTGEAQARGDHYYGVEISRCARVLALCHAGQVLVTSATRERLAGTEDTSLELWDLGRHRLKDLRGSERVFQLTDPDHPESFPALPSERTRLNNLPAQLTRFIGRERELAALRADVATARLLTLTGPGGSGKTRLALELAGSLQGDVRDGVWLTELAPLTDPALVPRAIAGALEIAEQPGRTVPETLIAHCEGRDLLLVLDNCEHLVDACAELTRQLLGECPGLRIIATSREALNVTGEVARAVQPLPSGEAVALFADRAGLRVSSFEITDQTEKPVAEICRRLDGIPLAIELAAARVAVMAPGEILQRLDAPSTVAAPSRAATPRQQTLEGAIDWSYRLLEEPERSLFRKVSVFAGSFSTDGLEQVCEGDIEVLGQLVSKSLVERAGDRYRCLDTIRSFGRRRLEEAGQLEVLRRRHAAHFANLAGGRLPGTLAAWLDRVEAEHDNLRAALDWYLETDLGAGAKLSRSLYDYWLSRGHVLEARSYLGRLRERLEPRSPDRRWALLDAVAFAYTAGDLGEGAALAAAAAADAAEEGDREAFGRARLAQGVIEIAAGEGAAAADSLSSALEVGRELGNRRMQGEVLHHLGVLASLQPDIDEARRCFAESLELRRAENRRDETNSTLTFLAAVALLQADLEASRAALTEALEISLSLLDRRVAWTLDVLACLAAVEGRPERALRLGGAATQMFEVTGQRPPPGWRRFTDPRLEQAREALTADQAGAAWEAGRAFQFEEAVHYALEGESAVVN